MHFHTDLNLKPTEIKPPITRRCTPAVFAGPRAAEACAAARQHDRHIWRRARADRAVGRLRGVLVAGGGALSLRPAPIDAAARSARSALSPLFIWIRSACPRPLSRAFF